MGVDARERYLVGAYPGMTLKTQHPGLKTRMSYVSFVTGGPAAGGLHNSKVYVAVEWHGGTLETARIKLAANDSARWDAGTS